MMYVEYYICELLYLLFWFHYLIVYIVFLMSHLLCFPYLSMLTGYFWLKWKEE
jgi:hypothetical protein